MGNRIETQYDDINLEKIINNTHPTSSKKSSFNPMDDNKIIEDFFMKSKPGPFEIMKQKILYQINNARSSPKALIPKVKVLEKKIRQISYGSYFLNVDEKTNIKLYKGLKAFEEAERFLEHQSPLPTLFMNEELAIEFPKEIEKFDKESYLTWKLKKKDEEMKKDKKIEIVNFHYDVMNGDVELSTLMQVIDDTNAMSQRRQNIFNKNVKYIGITVGRLNSKLFCIYIVFAKSLSKI